MYAKLRIYVGISILILLHIIIYQNCFASKRSIQQNPIAIAIYRRIELLFPIYYHHAPRWQ